MDGRPRPGSPGALSHPGLHRGRVAFQPGNRGGRLRYMGPRRAAARAALGVCPLVSAPLYRTPGGHGGGRAEPGGGQLQSGGSGDLSALQRGGDRPGPFPGGSAAVLFSRRGAGDQVRPGPVGKYAGTDKPGEGVLRRGEPAP
ncbi:hypothetical protein B5E67_03060 [Faecalibacterium sp. An122]|nr:hypothetical protein B5E67_03060 [Faecalibacterium sp. An122]